jgi:hypothetical protein
LHAKRIYFIIKLDYSMAKVYNSYTNKEFNRNYKKFQKAANIVEEWRNIKTIISQAANGSLGKYKAFTKKKKNCKYGG